MITLSLASGTSIKSGIITLALSIASTGGDQTTAVQWSFGFTSDVTLASVALGSAATVASKSLNRAGSLCVVAAVGTNNNIIGNGTLVTATFNIAANPSSGSIPISVFGVVATDVNGNGLTTSGSPGTITVDTPVLACPINGDSAIFNVIYSATLIASGGVGPYTFAIIG